MVQIEESVTVRELILLHGNPGDSLWIEETDVSVEQDVTLEAAGLRHHDHVHIHKCHRIRVRVRFGGSEITREFSPARRVSAVFEWAVGSEGFNLPPDQRPEHDLILCGGDHPISPTVHIGSLASDDCDVCLDLAAKHNPQG